MPVTIDATVGGASANSFITLAEASTYMDTRLNGSTWNSASTDDQNRALVEATRELSMRQWVGDRSTSTQALSWPRQWAEDPDAPIGGSWFSTSVVPQRVKDATAELAFQFIKAGTTDIAADDANAFVIEKTIDVLTTRYAEPYQRPRGLSRFPRVMQLIQPLLLSTGFTTHVLKG